MVDLTPRDDSLSGITIDVPEPSVNVQVFGEGSIGDAFGGFLEGIVGAFLSLMKKIISTSTSEAALANLTALLVVISALVYAYRTIGRPKGV